MNHLRPSIRDVGITPAQHRRTAFQCARQRKRAARRAGLPEQAATDLYFAVLDDFGIERDTGATS